MPPKKAASAAAKKPAAKSKAASKTTEISGSPTEQWLQRQATALEQQAEAAPEWLATKHAWHEEQLRSIMALLKGNDDNVLTSEFRESVEFYVSQFAEDADIGEDTFYDDTSMYTDVLEALQAAANQEQAPYQRLLEDTPEVAAVAQQISELSDTSMLGISKLGKLLTEHAASAAVQEAGLKRLAQLVGSQRGKPLAGAAVQGLGPSSSLPVISAAMSRFERDPQVQLAGCSSLGSFTNVEGALSDLIQGGGAELVVNSLRLHLKDLEVCRMSVRVLQAMTSKTEDPSIERCRIQGTDAAKLLMEVLNYHHTDLQIEKAARSLLPFLR